MNFLYDVIFVICLVLLLIILIVAFSIVIGIFMLNYYKEKQERLFKKYVAEKLQPYIDETFSAEKVLSKTNDEG